MTTAEILQIGFIIAWVLFFIPSCVILSKKHRGIGYYILAFIQPLIGFIVALCVSKQSPKSVSDNKLRVTKQIFCAISIIIVLGLIVQKLHQNTLDKATKIEHFSIPETWTTYIIDNSFSLSIPPTMELRSDFDRYSHTLSDLGIGYACSSADAVFQQKNLSDMSDEALNTYCRVLAMRIPSEDNDEPTLHHYESPKLQPSDYADLREIADAEVEPYSSYANYPEYDWIDIDGTKGIKIYYIRTGAKGDVICNIYLFFNYDDCAKIVTAYRKKDEQIWRNEIDNVIKTFKWNNPK